MSFLLFSLQKSSSLAWSGIDSALPSPLISLNNNNNTLVVNHNNTVNQPNINNSSTPSNGSITPSRTPVSSGVISPLTTTTSCGLTNVATMPVGGVQGQNPTQGLVHWMSAVMAEHMTSNSHHDPTVGMHYMWNGGVDVSL